MNTIKNYRDAVRLALGAAIAGSLFALPLASGGATYSFTDLNPSGFGESQAYGISGTQQVGFGDSGALVWSGTASSAVGLNGSICLGTSGSQQIGYGEGFGNGYRHALLWSGTTASVVDLTPIGFFWSEGFGISGTQQVGYGYARTGGFNPRALLWSGTASNAVDLTPTGFTWAVAQGISGSQQVGVGNPGAGNAHALLWSGTASSAVDLHPSGFISSEGSGVFGSQQVGFGVLTGNIFHALLWSGTASSVVDLNPTGFTGSYGFAISGSNQVGVGWAPVTGNNVHAMLWSGTASSAVDLHSFLSSDYSESYAEGIDANGNIVGLAYYGGHAHAILWTLLPQSVVICNDPGQRGAVATYSTGASVMCSPASDSFFPVGVTTVTCISTNPQSTYTFTVTVKDCEPPVVSCQPVHKPSDKKDGKADKDSEREEDLDGLYQLMAHDNCDPNPRLYIKDSVSGFVAGPFASGDIVKLTKKGHKDSEDLKDEKNARPPIVAHLGLQGDGLLYGVDASGNVGSSVLCPLPRGHGE